MDKNIQEILRLKHLMLKILYINNTTLHHFDYRDDRVVDKKQREMLYILKYEILKNIEILFKSVVGLKRKIKFEQIGFSHEYLNLFNVEFKYIEFSKIIKFLDACDIEINMEIYTYNKVKLRLRIFKIKNVVII